MTMGNPLMVLNELDASYLECDGLTRVISSLLSTARIPHKVFVGAVSHTNGKKISPHLWIELDSGKVIDYRLRMWLGQQTDIPHGIFDPSDFPAVMYKGQERESFGERDPVALILCSTAGMDFEKILREFQKSLRST